jgi:hypothetical protein
MFLKKKHKGFSLPSLTQRIPMTRRFLLNCKKILIYLENGKRNKHSLIYPCVGVHMKVCFAYMQVGRQLKKTENINFKKL